MKLIHTSLFSLLVCCTIFSCRKSDSKQSKVTSALCGSRSYHYRSYGYNPYLHAYVTDSLDTAATISCITADSALLGSYSFMFDSLTATGARHYHMTAPALNPGDGYLLFDATADTVFIYQNIHISAGAGSWAYTYRSF